jgi:hypothetical protein
MRCEEELLHKAECGTAGTAENILRIGFDSSTDFQTLFKRYLRKKLSCTIHGEEAKSLRHSIKHLSAQSEESSSNGSSL